MIRIIGTYGNQAFDPNPMMAAIGKMVVWKNEDRTLHRIVLDATEGMDEIEVGRLAPGASSLPVPLRRPVALFHCTIHPTMVGVIGDGSMPLPNLEPPPEEPPSGYYFSPFRLLRKR